MDSEPDPLILAYLAGVIDSDGSIGVKRSTYNMRITKTSSQPIYSEHVTITQAEPHAIDLACATFGGWIGVQAAAGPRRRPIGKWHLHSAAAGRALVLLLPYLRIKRAQAENALELRRILTESRVRRWEVPDIIEGEPLVTATEFAALVGADRAAVLQAVQKGSVPSLRRGRNRMMPVSFLEAYGPRARRKGAKPTRSAQVTVQLEACYQRAKALNRTGPRE